MVKDASGKVVELKCTYDQETRAGKTPKGMKKVKGIIHWLESTSAVPAEVRNYDRLFTTPAPGSDHPRPRREDTKSMKLHTQDKSWQNRNTTRFKMCFSTMRKNRFLKRFQRRAFFIR